jgi:DHA1 family florfenicol/chloramphenicol resistance protein-like MFS transporter
MHDKSKLVVAFILAPFVFSFAFGLDIYIPVVPEMQQVFHISQFMVQMTLSLFLMGTAIGQILFGPLSDRFGRYSVALFSSILFTLGALGCALSNDIGFLLVNRVICAFGACGMFVVAFAIIRDLYSGDDSAYMYSILNGAISVSPVFAPVIGSYLGVWFGWRSVFWFLVGLGLFITLSTRLFYKETLPVDKRISLNKTVFTRYLILFTSKTFVRSILLCGLGISICFSFFSISPFIIMDLLHVNKEYFGYYFAVFGLAIGVGGFLGASLIARIGTLKTIYVGLGCAFLGGLAMLVINLIFGLYLMPFLLTMAVACVGAVFICGASAAQAMEPFPDMAGTASAGLGMMQFLIAAIVGSVLMRFPITSSMSFAICILIISVVMFFLLLSQIKGAHHVKQV